MDSSNYPDCGEERQTVEHVLLRCSKFVDPRLLLKNSLPRSFNFSLSQILYPLGFTKHKRKSIYELIHAFLLNIYRAI